jgi:hypothetical protein
MFIWIRNLMHLDVREEESTNLNEIYADIAEQCDVKITAVKRIMGYTGRKLLHDSAWKANYYKALEASKSMRQRKTIKYDKK